MLRESTTVAAGATADATGASFRSAVDDQPAAARRWSSAHALSANLWQRAVGVVALRSGLAREDVLRPRNRAARRARALAIYLVVVEGCVPVKRSARLAGRSPRTVRRALSAIETAREDAAFDRLVSTLEQRMQS